MAGWQGRFPQLVARHEGKDLTEGDGVFEILIVRGIRAVVLVTSGNSTFETGPRKDLLAWLRQQEGVLRKENPRALTERKREG